MIELKYFLVWINKILNLLSMSIDKEDTKLTVAQRSYKHWGFILQLVTLNMSNIGQILWFVQGIVLGKSIVELTFLLPCLTLCILGNFKAHILLCYPHHIQELLQILERLQIEKPISQQLLPEMQKWMKFLRFTLRSTLSMMVIGLGCFGVVPFVLMTSQYLNTGEFVLILPFIVWYPFDEHDIRIYPFVYIQQMAAGWVTIFSLYAVDSLFFVFCVYISAQFIILCNNMENVTKCDDENLQLLSFRERFVPLVKHYIDIIRCVDLLEIIYTKSTLYFVLTSSLVLCAAGFNLMALDNKALMVPYVPFFGYGLLQILLYCYYGDYIMKLSQAVGDSVYNGDWNKLGPVQRKYIYITIIRSQKPCRLTAFGFSVINLRTFTRILSTSWSYFALLRQMFIKK